MFGYSVLGRTRSFPPVMVGLLIMVLAGCSSSTSPPSAAGSSSSSGSSSSGGAVPTPQPITPSGEAVTAVEAAAGMGAGFNLGQTFENTQHPRTFYSARPKIDAYYNMGYRNVRIPITWTEPVGGDTLVHDPDVGDVDFDHPRLNEIAQIVDYALSLPGMYVIINAHHERDLKNDNKWSVLERLWLDIATAFGDRDHRLMFQLLNEPHLNNDAPMLAANLRFMSGKAYDKIRAVNSQRMILIGGNQWFGAGEMAQVWFDLNPVGGGADPYVMASFHHYNPWAFSGDNRDHYAFPWTEDNLTTPIDTMLEWANGAGEGMPIYIGEWGVGWQSTLATMDCNNIRQWYAQMHVHNAAQQGVPTSVWDDGGWFKVFDHRTNAFDNELATCLIEGECEWSGTERFNSGCFP